MSKKVNKNRIEELGENELTQYLQIYDQVNEVQRYEGAGIWSRFNILVSLNIVLFGVLTFVITSKLSSARTLFIVVSISGALFSIWAIYVLRRLWLWHSHWKITLQNIESKFPSYLPRPFSTRPENLKKSNAWYQSWLTSYTQPFMFILSVMWTVLLILSIKGVIFQKELTKANMPTRSLIKANSPMIDTLGNEIKDLIIAPTSKLIKNDKNE